MELITTLNNSTNNINTQLDNYNEINTNYQTNKTQIKAYKLFIFKKLCALAITLSIPIGVFFGTKNLFKIKAYKVNQQTYNSYIDDITEESYYSVDAKEGITAYKYEVISDKGNYYKVYEYNLNNLNYSNIDDYINYYKINENNIKNYVNVKAKQATKVPEKTDYFEIIYKVVNTEDIEYATFYSSLIGLAMTFLPFCFCCAVAETIIESYSSEYSKLKELINNNKNNKKEIIELCRNILEEINNNEYLRLKFNNELSKHKEIIDALDYEIIDTKYNNEKTLKLIKENIKN